MRPSLPQQIAECIANALDNRRHPTIVRVTAAPGEFAVVASPRFQKRPAAPADGAADWRPAFMARRDVCVGSCHEIFG
jgi:hypothetical protein